VETLDAINVDRSYAFISALIGYVVIFCVEKILFNSHSILHSVMDNSHDSHNHQHQQHHSQDHSQNNNGDGNYSAHAREAIETTLPPGEYLLRVDIKSHNFDANSRIRLAANGPNISFIDQSPDASVMIPADNPNVLTVGASDDVASSAGVTSGGIQKPEVVAPSMIQFESGIAFQGSSSAAAVAAATLAVYQDVCGRLTRQQIVAKITNGLLSQRSTVGRGLWLPATGRCL
jgi:hypothetical protein